MSASAPDLPLKNTILLLGDDLFDVRPTIPFYDQVEYQVKQQSSSMELINASVRGMKTTTLLLNNKVISNQDKWDRSQAKMQPYPSSSSLYYLSLCTEVKPTDIFISIGQNDMSQILTNSKFSIANVQHEIDLIILNIKVMLESIKLSQPSVRIYIVLPYQFGIKSSQFGVTYTYLNYKYVFGCFIKHLITLCYSQNISMIDLAHTLDPYNLKHYSDQDCRQPSSQFGFKMLVSLIKHVITAGPPRHNKCTLYSWKTMSSSSLDGSRVVEKQVDPSESQPDGDDSPQQCIIL